MSVSAAARKMLGGCLPAFAAWFSSGPGVWQTAVVTMAVVVAELIDRSLDPHAFMLMAVLTVYSAITQPALAYAGARSATQMEQVLARLQATEAQNAALLAQVAALLDHHDIPQPPQPQGEPAC